MTEQSNMDYVNSLESCIKEWVPEGEGQDELLGFVGGLHRRFAEIADELELWESYEPTMTCEAMDCEAPAEWNGWYRVLDPFTRAPLRPN